MGPPLLANTFSLGSSGDGGVPTTSKGGFAVADSAIRDVHAAGVANAAASNPQVAGSSAFDYAQAPVREIENTTARSGDPSATASNFVISHGASEDGERPCVCYAYAADRGPVVSDDTCR